MLEISWFALLQEHSSNGEIASVGLYSEWLLTSASRNTGALSKAFRSFSNAD